MILADILPIGRIFPSPATYFSSHEARKNSTQLAKYPHVLYVKPSNKMHRFHPIKGFSETIYNNNKIIFFSIKRY